MSIEALGIEQEVDEKKQAEMPPTTVDEVNDRFSSPIEITSPEDIVSYFSNNIDSPRICISIPITTQDEETRKSELLLIGHHLTHAIFDYTNLDKKTDIGYAVQTIIAEATSDVAKHTVLREKFDHILALVTKDSNVDISFHLVNPARSDVNFNEINKEDAFDDYGKEAHGTNLTRGLGEDLRKMGCKWQDEHHLVCDETGTIGAERDCHIGLPDNIKI